MKTTLKKIGTSRGVIIPKIYLEQCHFDQNVEISIEHNAIIVKPILNSSRAGWREAFDKQQLDNVMVDFLSLPNEFDRDWKW